MTWEDAKKQDAINKRNGWGISYPVLRQLISLHKHARSTGNIRVMEIIEYRLTDINFHSECAAIRAGDYESVQA